jgi:hypothetical protein
MKTDSPEQYPITSRSELFPKTEWELFASFVVDEKSDYYSFIRGRLCNYAAGPRLNFCY